MFAISLLKSGSAIHGTKVIAGVVGISFIYSGIYQDPAKCVGLEDESSSLSLTGPLQITFGGVLGFTAGYVLKQVGRLAALGVGLVFLTFQALHFNGYIYVDWNRIRKSTITVLDQDGDGDLDEDDVRILKNKILRFVQFNFPSTGSFVPFFWLGIQYG